MTANRRQAGRAGASGSTPGHRGRALAISVSTFIITAITLGCTAGAFLWGGLALIGLRGTVNLVASILAVGGVMPVAVWLAYRAYRIEMSGELDAAAEGLAGGRYESGAVEVDSPTLDSLRQTMGRPSAGV